MEMTAAQKRVVDSIIEAAGLDADAKIVPLSEGSKWHDPTKPEILWFNINTRPGSLLNDQYYGSIGLRGGVKFTAQITAFGKSRKYEKLSSLLILLSAGRGSCKQ